MADNGKLVFVGGYAPAGEPGLRAMRFDQSSGQLVEVGATTAITNPSFLIPHPNGQWLYAVSEMGQGSNGSYGAVWALSLEQQDGQVTFTALNSQSSDGDWPCHLVLDRTGKWLFAANYGTGNVAVYPIQADGSLGPMQQFLQHEGNGPNTARQEQAHAHSTIVSPDNRFVIVADLGIDALVVYRFDAAAGTLERQAAVASAPGAGPRHSVFNPAGTHLYVANELDSTVTVYRYDAAAGSLAAGQTLPTIPAPDPENTVADIHFDAAAAHLYVSNRGHNSIATYKVNEDGDLAAGPIVSCGGNWPRNFALVPAGSHMLVANQYSDAVATLPLNDADAVPGEAIAQTAALAPACIQFAN